MGYILVGRKKGSKGKFKNMGPYEYEKKSQFGSLARVIYNPSTGYYMLYATMKP